MKSEMGKQMPIKRRRHRIVVWIAALILVPSCGRGDSAVDTSGSSLPPPGEPGQTGTTAFHWSPSLCDLSTVLRAQQGSVLGTIESIQTGLTGLPWDEPDREYALLTVAVTSVIGQRELAESGNPLPSISAGQKLSVVLYPDVDGTPLEPAMSLQDSASPVFIGLFGYGEWSKPDQEGMWFVRRIAEEGPGSVSFYGACSEQLDSQLKDLADALSRAADLSLVADFALEVLERYDEPENNGPIESTMLQVNDLNTSG